MVEIEVRKAQPGAQQDSTQLDVNEMISKIRSFVDSVREMTSDGEPMTVSVEGFNVSLAKDRGEYEFALKLSLAIKPKAAAA